MEALAIASLVAAGVLWLRVRKLERARRQSNPPPEPAPPSDVEKRLQVLERAERSRSVRELKS